MKIAIGICARNEESSIIPMLDSLILSIPNNLNNKFHIFICANGCSDQTIPLIQSWQMKNSLINSDLFIIDEANLVESQRIIVEKSKKLHFESIIFLDADIILDRNCISELIKNSINENVQAVYAVSIPTQRKKQSLIEKILNLYDTSSEMFSLRKHLHGRAFLIKTEAWNVPETNPKLIADDIYLSFYLLQKYGERSIKKVDTAKIYFHQISSYSDFYNTFRRRQIEINKCFVLFPDFKMLPHSQVNRKFLWKNLPHQSLTDIFLWLSLIFLKKITKLQFKFESFFGLGENSQWRITETSKKLDVNKKPILILIEGLDCSGKKTTARLLQNKLISNGISCLINIGPLNSKFYRLTSRLVSLHKCPNFVRSMVYAFDGSGDSKWYKNFNSQIVIQISSPMRNWSYAIVNHKYIRIFIMHLIKKNLPKYDLIYYLTAPYNTRIERHAHQVKFGENPEEIKKRFPQKEVFDQMEFELKKLLNINNKIKAEFDTTISSYKDIIDNIVVMLKKIN
ncbi:MAG: hypothetical protein ABIF22_03095 [bacterium]